MAITIIKEPNTYCFIGNSVLFELETDLSEAIAVDIMCNGSSHKASYYPFKKDDRYLIRFDISGYLDVPPKISEYPEGELISILSDFGIGYQVKIGDDYLFEGTAFRGGIDKETLKILMKDGFDIFTYRLGSHFDQFLFTTRTHSKFIRLKDSELYPFVFIHPGIDISFKSEFGNTITTSAHVDGSICVMDIEAVRLNFFYQFGENPKMIEVWISEESVFTFQIQPKQISEESYLIKFKNSLGAYEVIEVVGSAKHEPLISDPNIYQSVTDFDFFSDRRDRLQIQDLIKVESGYKTKDEILFIRDMICSDETYFIYPDGSFFRCNVSIDKLSYQQKQVTPHSIPFIITNENNSSYVSPHLDWSTLMSGAGVFDDSFDDTFE